MPMLEGGDGGAANGHKSVCENPCATRAVVVVCNSGKCMHDHVWINLMKATNATTAATTVATTTSAAQAEAAATATTTTTRTTTTDGGKC